MGLENIGPGANCMERNPLIVIPASIFEDGEDSVVEAWRRAVEAGIGNVIVDSDDDAIVRAVGRLGGYIYREGVEPDNASHNYRTDSGAERVAATVNKFDRFYNHDIVVNLHGGLPSFDPALIRALMYPLASQEVDIATLVEPLDEEQAADTDIVKVQVEWIERRRIHVLAGARAGRAITFSRDPAGVGGKPFFRHIPVYAYKRASLDRFVRHEPSLRELEERLEPMRAIECGMRVDVVMAAAGPANPAK